MSNNVVAVVPVRGGEYKKTNLEAVSEAARIASALGGEAIAIAIGTGVAGVAAGLGKYGAARVVTLDNGALENYNGDLWGKVVADLAKKLEPAAILMAASAQGKDLGPRVAAHLETGYAADITEISAEGGTLSAKRPVYAGKSYISVAFNGSPAVASLRPNNFAVTEEGADCPVEAGEAEIPEVGSQVLEVKTTGAGAKADLTEAARVVAGGRGLKGAEGFGILESLAELLDATMGATRAAVDAGWRPHSDQIGQTGKTISPNLYIGAGISGAIQHLAGMRTAKCIVAINKDPEAPIFNIADYGIVADLFEIVPALETELKSVLE
ncbi:electron transfer flavoprotein subunit alpha/FixB family protein [Planctomycetota bacterium]